MESVQELIGPEVERRNEMRSLLKTPKLGQPDSRNYEPAPLCHSRDEFKLFLANVGSEAPIDKTDSDLLISVVRSTERGDVYEYPLEESKAAPQLLMGRLSMLLDMTLTPSNDFLIVCDRDEKIQVSVGGDGQLKLWNFRTGKCLASFDCWADAAQVERLQPFEQYCGTNDGKKIRPPLKKVLSCGPLVVVIYSRVPYIHISQCEAGETFKNLGGVFTERAVWDATLDQSSRLWMLTPSLTVYKLDTLGLHSEVKPAPEITRCFEDLLGPLRDVPERDDELDSLYKQWFDNVEEYLQRKKTRQEEKQLKKRKVHQNKLAVR